MISLQTDMLLVTTATTCWMLLKTSPLHLYGFVKGLQKLQSSSPHIWVWLRSWLAWLRRWLWLWWWRHWLGCLSLLDRRWGWHHGNIVLAHLKQGKRITSTTTKGSWWWEPKLKVLSMERSISSALQEMKALVSCSRPQWNSLTCISLEDIMAVLHIDFTRNKR